MRETGCEGLERMNERRKIVWGKLEEIKGVGFFINTEERRGISGKVKILEAKVLTDVGRRSPFLEGTWSVILGHSMVGPTRRTRRWTVEKKLHEIEIWKEKKGQKGCEGWRG